MTESTVDNAIPPLHVAPGPHVASRALTTRRMMVDVLIGLAPALVVAGIVFRQWLGIQLAVSVGACVLAEFAFATLRGRRATVGDFSAVVTGVILALSLPALTPVWVTIIAGVMAIGLGKMVFGGVGMNIFNPAMVGRAFVMIAFAGYLSAGGYSVALSSEQREPTAEIQAALDNADTPDQKAAAQQQLEQLLDQRRLDKAWGVEAVTQATPMTDVYKGIQKQQQAGGEFDFHTDTQLADSSQSMLMKLFLGNTNGSLGETSALALILGGLYLCIRRTASWEIPAGAVAALVVYAGVGNLLNTDSPWTVAHHLLGGAFLLGAFFIITDPVSSPLTPKGKFIYGAIFGLLVMLIRSLTDYPEGVMFSVLIVNAIAPLINRWTIPTPVGGPVPEKKP